MTKIDSYRRLVNQATQWSRTGKASAGVRPYVNRVVPAKTPSVDRGFWLGEVLDAIRLEAATVLSVAQQRDLERMIDLATATARTEKKLPAYKSDTLEASRRLMGSGPFLEERAIIHDLRSRAKNLESSLRTYSWNDPNGKAVALKVSQLRQQALDRIEQLPEGDLRTNMLRNLYS